ncbi:MAG: YlxM family DNA-binding protein [Firmicutes bacterium]|jgi:predicted DNA-binding protein YlxM (UPF0122 family)|nr:YlxM family DNA-binding protein [Bacillota bacterium]
MIEKKLRLSSLFNFYGNLLTDKQKEILEQYCDFDLSLGEIAENLKISRQAVYDTVKRAEKVLESYEDKLGLIAKFDLTIEKASLAIKEIDLIEAKINSSSEFNDLDQLEKVKQLINEIME